MSAGTGVVSEPNPIVLDTRGRFVLLNLFDLNDLSVRFLHFLQLPEEVPEPGFGHNMVRCEDCHPVEGGRRVYLIRHVATDYPVLT